MRIDYRYLRMISVPAYIVAVVLLVLVFVPEPRTIVVGGSARWLKIGPLPAIHPAEIAKLAMVIYLAHWFAKRGTKISRLLVGDDPVPDHHRADPRAGLPRAGPRHDDGPRPDGVHDVLPGRGEPLPPRGDGASSPSFAIIAAGLRGYQIERIQAWLNPWADPDCDRASTRSRGCSRSGSAGSSARDSARAASPAACSCRTRATTTSSRSSARSSG